MKCYFEARQARGSIVSRQYGIWKIVLFAKNARGGNVYEGVRRAFAVNWGKPLPWIARRKVVAITPDLMQSDAARRYATLAMVWLTRSLEPAEQELWEQVLCAEPASVALRPAREPDFLRRADCCWGRSVAALPAWRRTVRGVSSWTVAAPTNGRSQDQRCNPPRRRQRPRSVRARRRQTMLQARHRLRVPEPPPLRMRPSEPHPQSQSSSSCRIPVSRRRAEE